MDSKLNRFLYMLQILFFNRIIGENINYDNRMMKQMVLMATRTVGRSQQKTDVLAHVVAYHYLAVVVVVAVRRMLMVKIISD